ncbi:PREDICTED: uncharacterized protein LOC109335493 [Lupinus angustifolius]|uniref:uncharacterized protein LOC109335493 n=1 Tax=Lupinus angustifolius TaxID=3871 RepID=UPI00092F74AB|nr:PREDICTED: uncharacterized protein LOC109335493 [Lupinus angustifolius]
MNLGQNSTTFPAHLPILDGKNWNRWSAQMKVIFGYQEVMEIVESGFAMISNESTNEEKAEFKVNKKMDCKTMFLIQQCVDNAYFKKIVGATSSHDAWKILEQCNDGAEQLKKVKLQTMRRQYELMQMENSEIGEFFNRVVTLTNAMKVLGETMTKQTIVEKIICTLTPRFDHIVVSIEESKKMDDLKIDQLQGSLEAHEQRILERSNEKPADQALQAQTSRR